MIILSGEKVSKAERRRRNRILKMEEDHQKKILTIDSVDIFHCYLATVSSGLKFKGTNTTF